MAIPLRKHAQADCPGTFARIYERAGRGAGFSPLGYICTGCREVIFDEDHLEMPTLDELRFPMESVANELIGLFADSHLNAVGSSIVRNNPKLLASAQSGNPYLLAIRRWYAIASALVLRRHIDAGTPNTLRSIVEHLAQLERAGETRTLPAAGSFGSDLDRLKALSARFRPYISAVINGGHQNAGLTYDDLDAALDEVRQIAQRAYATITNVSLLMTPSIATGWTDIFQEPWILANVPSAYEVGAEGVPFDALPLTMEESNNNARLVLRMQCMRPNQVAVSVENVGAAEAIDVRVFLPYLRTIVDVPRLEVHKETHTRVEWDPNYDREPKFGYGQAVLEFEDAFGHIFRQYADVDIRDGMVRKLSPIPFLVKGRIVAPGPAVIEH
ncbi:MAG TPA: hypothetical protein VMT89_03960 [Candidatus Acidoferrales bacterium]|nr:hypothetical protein [Candidatus Acidoferrales bacterium]